MSTVTTATSNPPNSSDSNEIILEIPVWVNGKRKWVTGITKKTTFDDLIYALLVQADLLTNSSSNSISGYAIAECIQSTSSSTESVLTQRILKGRTKVIKIYKTWQFDKLPLTILQLISTSSIDNPSTTTKFRSKIFRRFLSSKHLNNNTNNHHHHQDEINQKKIINNYQENLNILERQKRLLEYLDEKIHQTEKNLSSSDSVVTLNDVSHLLSTKPIQQEQLILATQLCNSIFNIQEHIDEKINLSNAVEQAISNELNHVLHYDTLTLNPSDNSNSSNDLISLKNSIYRSRELSRIQSKEMHDLDLSLREVEILIGSKYDELKYLEYETSSNSFRRSRSLTPNSNFIQQTHIEEQRLHQQQQTTYDTIEIGCNSMKEIDEDSGINSLTSEDSNHHLQKINTQLETLV